MGEIAFGRVRADPRLLSILNRVATAPQRIACQRRLLSEPPGPEGNRVRIGHVHNPRAAAGIGLAEGAAALVLPMGGAGAPAGRHRAARGVVAPAPRGRAFSALSFPPLRPYVAPSERAGTGPGPFAMDSLSCGAVRAGARGPARRDRPQGRECARCRASARRATNGCRSGIREQPR